MMNIKRMPSCIAVVVAALLLAVSCGNMLEAPKAEGVEGGMGRLSVSMGDGRAVFPEELEFGTDKELTFTLSGSLSGGEGKEIRSWTAGGDKTAHQVMAADTSLTVEAGRWSFTLQAKRGGTVVATANKDLEVKGGQENRLSFGTMAYSNEGTGTVTVTLSWNEGEEVTSVVAGLYNASDDTMVENTQQTLTPAESKVTYTKSDVPAGTYRLKTQMKQEETVIGTYSELVRVAGGLSSVAERNLESLNTLYTVTLDLGGQGELRTTFPETYNRSQTVTLPTAEQVASNTGAVFLHWYEEGDTGMTPVTQIPGLDGDKTYCAYWQVASVTFSPAGDTLYYGDTVTLSTTTDGATIQYKLDDGEWMDYTEETPISVTTITTITAKATKATKEELKPSTETTATYTVRKLEGITVTTLPARTVYSVGQSFDPTGMIVTATYEGGEKREVTGWETNFSTVADVKGLNNPVTVSYVEGDTSKSDTFTVTVFPKEVKVLTELEYTSPNHTGSEWTYVAFGEWPQTIKEESVEIGAGTLVRGGLTYYLGNDGNHYVKAEEKADGSGTAYKYSNGDQAGQGGTSTKWFKVEPIVWRVLTTSYKAPEGGTVGEILLLAEKILTGGVPYYGVYNVNRTVGEATIYPNNYEHSEVRAWLNGLEYQYKGSDGDEQIEKEDYFGKGFLQTAFTESARKLIADTSVDNSAASTFGTGENTQENPYACDKTKDKIFLLSQQEATNSEYGFAAYDAYGKGSTRIRVTTDYAKATGAYQSSTPGYGGRWWLRSPNYGIENRARDILDYGYAISFYSLDVYLTYGGVVPALSISLQ